MMLHRTMAKQVVQRGHDIARSCNSPVIENHLLPHRWWQMDDEWHPDDIRTDLQIMTMTNCPGTPIAVIRRQHNDAIVVDPPMLEIRDHATEYAIQVMHPVGRHLLKPRTRRPVFVLH